MHSNHLAFCRLKPRGVSGIWLLTWKSFSCQTNPFPCTFLCKFVSVAPGGRLRGGGYGPHCLGRLLHTAPLTSSWVSFNLAAINSFIVSLNWSVIWLDNNGYYSEIGMSQLMGIKWTNLQFLKSLWMASLFLLTNLQGLIRKAHTFLRHFNFLESDWTFWEIGTGLPFSIDLGYLGFDDLRFILSVWNFLYFSEESE